MRKRGFVCWIGLDGGGKYERNIDKFDSTANGTGGNSPSERGRKRKKKKEKIREN